MKTSAMADNRTLLLNRARRWKTRNVSRRITELLQNLVGMFAVLRAAAHQAARRPAFARIEIHSRAR
jgi:hypothetical protein